MKDTKKINLTELNLNLDERDLKQEIKSLKVLLEQQQIQQIEKEYKYNE